MGRQPLRLISVVRIALLQEDCGLPLARRVVGE